MWQSAELCPKGWQTPPFCCALSEHPCPCTEGGSVWRYTLGCRASSQGPLSWQSLWDHRSPVCSERRWPVAALTAVSPTLQSCPPVEPMRLLDVWSKPPPQTETGLTHLPREVALLPQWVLVDGDDVSVLQQLFRAWADVSEVIGHEQRGCHDGPQCHLRLLLVVTQAKVSYHQLEKNMIENTSS